MRNLQSVIAFLAVTALAANQAQAANPLTYPFAIRVTQQDNAGICPLKGQILTMFITVDRSIQPSLPKDHTATYQGNTGNPNTSPILSFSFGGRGNNPIQPFISAIYVQRDNKGVYGYTFLGEESSEGFILNLTTTQLGIVNTYRLPGSIVPASFQTKTFEFYTKQEPCYGTVVAR